jgi:DNA-directed RNA polymerase subunit K/omega
MMNPDYRGILTKDISRYGLVVASAKLAREIAAQAEEDREIMTEKPVTLALEQLLNKRYTIQSPNASN